MHFVLLVHIFCSLVFLSMVFGGCVCICVGLHLEPTAFYPLWEGIYTCFWDRCRVRGREGTAFPCIPFSDFETLDFSSSGSLLGRPTETMVKAVRRMRSLSDFHRDMDVSCHRWQPSRCPVEGPKCAVCRRHRPENCFSKAVDTSSCSLFVLCLVCKFDRILETLIPGAADQAPQDCRDCRDCRLLRESHQNCFP